MRKRKKTGFLLFLVLTTFLFNSCEKQERYDLFPLNVGNEFYYKYYKYRFTGISAYTIGTETWRIVSESTQGNLNTYRIERKLNATLKVAGQTIVFSDSISYTEASEDRSSSTISFMDFNFKRYQDVSQAEVKREMVASNGIYTCSALFKVDSGMTYYSYYHPPNNITRESLSLDSLKIFQ